MTGVLLTLLASLVDSSPDVEYAFDVIAMVFTAPVVIAFTFAPKIIVIHRGEDGEGKGSRDSLPLSEHQGDEERKELERMHVAARKELVDKLTELTKENRRLKNELKFLKENPPVASEAKDEADGNAGGTSDAAVASSRGAGTPGTEVRARSTSLAVQAGERSGAGSMALPRTASSSGNEHRRGGSEPTNTYSDATDA